MSNSHLSLASRAVAATYMFVSYLYWICTLALLVCVSIYHDTYTAPYDVAQITAAMTSFGVLDIYPVIAMWSRLPEPLIVLFILRASLTFLLALSFLYPPTEQAPIALHDIMCVGIWLFLLAFRVPHTVALQHDLFDCLCPDKRCDFPYRMAWVWWFSPLGGFSGIYSAIHLHETDSCGYMTRSLMYESVAWLGIWCLFYTVYIIIPVVLAIIKYCCKANCLSCGRSFESIAGGAQWVIDRWSVRKEEEVAV